MIASVSWESGRETTAIVRSGNSQWNMNLSGHIHPCITARTAGQKGFTAQFRPMANGEGVLLVENGRKYYWMKGDLSSNERWSLLDENHWPVMTLQSGICMDGGKGDIANVSVDKRIMESPCFPLVASLGLFALMLHREDSGSYHPKEEVYLNMGLDKRMGTIFI